METKNNPVAGYIEAQLNGTAGIVQAAMQGMQRVQEIMLRAMREGASGQMALAQSISGAREPADVTQLGSEHAGPAAERFNRYQQELLNAVTEMNTEMIQASYSMMERVSSALAASASAMGTGGAGTGGNPMAAFQAGMRQWQGAMDRLSEGVAEVASAGAQAGSQYTRQATERATASSGRKTSARRSGRR